MSVTLTVTGTEGILASLQNLSNRLSGPEIVTELSVMASAEIHRAAPVGRRGDAGLLQRTLSETSPAEPTGDGWRAGVGNMDGILPLQPAPRGTIKYFLEKMGYKKFDGSGGKKKAGTQFNPWRALSDKQKSELRTLRESGDKRAGGSSPYRPFYWHVQDQGSAGAGITGSQYLTKAIHVIKSRIGSTILKVLGREGGGPIITGYN